MFGWFFMVISLIIMYFLDPLTRRVYYDKKKTLQFISAVSLVLLLFTVPLLFFADYTLPPSYLLLSLAVSFLFLFGLVTFLEGFSSLKFRIQNYAIFFFLVPVLTIFQTLLRNPNDLVIFVYLIPIALVAPMLSSIKITRKNLPNLLPSFSFIALMYFFINVAQGYGPITTLVLFSVSFAFASQLFNILYFRNSAEILESKNFINHHLVKFVFGLFIFLIVYLACISVFKQHFALLYLSFLLLLYERKMDKNMLMILFSILFIILILLTFF